MTDIEEYDDALKTLHEKNEVLRVSIEKSEKEIEKIISHRQAIKEVKDE